MIEIDELFFSVMSCRRYRSQMFLKIDVLRNFASFTRKHLCWSLFLIKLQATLLKIRSFTEHLQWLLLWFLQQNNLIFSVITITLGYNQKLSWKYKNKKSLYKNKKSLYKNIHLLSKVRLSSPKIFVAFPTKIQTSWSSQAYILYNFNIFEEEWCIP